MKDEMVWLFQFQSQYATPSMHLIHQVYTADEKLMKAFLKQHKFHDGESYVKYVNLNDMDVDVDGIEELSVFKIGSNKLHKVINLVSTWHFIEKTCLDVCSKISQVSLFGDMVQRDLTVINDVQEQIHGLTFGCILDIGTDEYTELNVRCRDPKNQLYSSLEEWANNTYPYETFDPDAPDDAYIYDSLCEETTLSVGYNTVLPFTLESYIEYFVSLLTDEYT